MRLASLHPYACPCQVTHILLLNSNLTNYPLNLVKSFNLLVFSFDTFMKQVANSWSCNLYHSLLALKMKVAQSCPALCNPMGYTVHGILQARILVWVAFSFSRGSSSPRNQTGVSCIAGRFFTN